MIAERRAAFGVVRAATCCLGDAVQEGRVSDPVYKIVELVGTSEDSISDAIDGAVEKAAESIRNLGWFQVTEIRGAVKNGEVSRYQVTLKAGFTIDSPDD